jgi:aspartate aminotransferase-like enzyme
MIHHRTPQWQGEFEQVLTGLQRVIGTTYPVAVFASSGTGAMESAVANLVAPGDEVVVASFGRFGERWAEAATSWGATVHHHRTEWGKRPDPDAIAEFCAQHPSASVVFCTHSETSTGTVSDAPALASALRRACGDDAVLVIDAISALGAAPMKMDEWGWDVVISGSQKALMCPPGLGFAAISDRARAYAASRGESRVRSFYFDWEKTVKAQAKSPASTAFTPASSIVQGLRVALELMFDEGLEHIYERHARHGAAIRAGVQTLGFDLFSPDDPSSVVLTAVAIPDNVDGAAIPKQMRDEYGVTVAGGQAHMKGKIVRLGHCGWVNDFDMLICIGAFERALTELGVDAPVGTGVAATQQSLLQGA